MGRTGLYAGPSARQRHETLGRSPWRGQADSSKLGDVRHAGGRRDRFGAIRQVL
jgi:hypothetical protein